MNGLFYGRVGKGFHELPGDVKLCSWCLKRSDIWRHEMFADIGHLKTHFATFEDITENRLM